MERAQNRLSAGIPPCVWCGSGREVTLSLTGKKKRIAHLVSRRSVQW